MGSLFQGFFHFGSRLGAPDFWKRHQVSCSESYLSLIEQVCIGLGPVYCQDQAKEQVFGLEQDLSGLLLRNSN